ncbi:unnamed protein product [Caenorhabditis auriculariae]|uniref:Fringe-like glycosyltransferase domain-containing protein n=1 Tax=Caenorhabditis auriculariae TaxID=2777116 RepID=A0A8S1GRC6_9PELO|nr:unnamed protein product [Caenorhabditis auriculariae]
MRTASILLHCMVFYFHQSSIESKSPENDVIISVKTSGKFHQTRVMRLTETWWNDAPEQIFLFTDVDDEALNETLKGHLRNTRCGSGHDRFGTGGAGICLSRRAACRINEYLDENDFVSTCNRLGVPDDVTLGYIASVVLKTFLTNIESFHSHLEDLTFLPDSVIDKQILHADTRLFHPP